LVIPIKSRFIACRKNSKKTIAAGHRRLKLGVYKDPLPLGSESFFLAAEVWLRLKGFSGAGLARTL